MAQQTTVQLTGVLVASPAVPSLYSCTLQELINLGFCATYGATKNGVLPIASPGSPVALPFEGIIKGRMFAMRLLSGATMKVVITTASQGPAACPVSNVLLVHNPNPGDEITGITFQGTGDIAYVLSGDVT